MLIAHHRQPDVSAAPQAGPLATPLAGNATTGNAPSPVLSLRRAGVFLLLCTLILTLSSRASAQLDNLDKNTLIQGLSRDGMSELLLHMAETEQFRDESDRLMLIVGQRRAIYANVNLEPAVRFEALSQALVAMRDLIEKHFDHDQRALWETDEAELILSEYLPIAQSRAAEFYEFGDAVADQREAFLKAVPEAHYLLADAARRLDVLQGDLPRRTKNNEYAEKFENTGLWARMMEEYKRLKVPYYYAQAAYYVAILDDSHPYYQDLGIKPGQAAGPKAAQFVRNLQKKTPAEEKARLLILAADRLDIFLKDVNNQYGVHAESLFLIGRILAAQGKHDEALAQYKKVHALGKTDYNDLFTHLAASKSLDASGKTAEAIQEVDALARHPIVMPMPGGLLMRLLVTDRKFQILLGHGEVDKAYQVYSELINDPALGAYAESLKAAIYSRWEAGIKHDEPLDKLPTAVLLAVAEVSRTAGQGLAVEAIRRYDQAAKKLAEANTAPPARAAVLKNEIKDLQRIADQYMAQATPKMQRAVQILEAVLKRPGLIPADHAKAMMDLGFATFFLKPDIATRLQAASIFIDMADKFHDQKDAQRAITIAVAEILVPLRQHKPRPAGVNELYVRAVKVLLEKYAGAEVTSSERLDYAQEFLVPQGMLQEAVTVLDGVPQLHPNYYGAQQLALHCLMEIYKTTPEGQARLTALRVVRERAARLRDQAEQALNGATPELRPLILEASGTARLTSAELSIDAKDTKGAIADLVDFENKYKGNAMLIRRALGMRITALADVGQLETTVQEADKMMKQFPDDAAYVIDQVLTRFETQIDHARKLAADAGGGEAARNLHTQRAVALANAAVELARLLLKWAEALPDAELLKMVKVEANHPSAPYYLDRVPWKLPLLKALRVAGQYPEALKILEPLRLKYTDDPDILFNVAETRFYMGTPDDLKAAEAIYLQFITLKERPAEMTPALRQMWWNAWMRHLQICDKLQIYVTDILLNIRRLRETDPNLGGDPYRSVIQNLEIKYRTITPAPAPKPAPAAAPAKN